MRLRIYEMEHSPYCIPISQALIALGVDFERKIIPNWDRSEIIRLTEGKYYQVPVIEHGDKVIYESSNNSIDVARYVDMTFGEGKLFPGEFAGIQDILIEYIESEVEFNTFRLVDPFYIDKIESLEDRINTKRHKERAFGRGCVEDWRSKKSEIREALDKQIDRFEKMLSAHDYLLGNSPVYSDFALLGVMENMCYNNWNALYSTQSYTREWMKRMKAFRYEEACAQSA